MASFMLIDMENGRLAVMKIALSRGKEF